MLKLFSQNFSKLLKHKVEEMIPKVQADLKNILKNHRETVVDQVKIDHLIMGMKELPLMFYPCSSLDPKEGIRFRGLTINDMQAKLPKVLNEPIPEAVFWLLMTGQIPTEE